MYEEIIKNINKSMDIYIRNEKYKVLSKTFYTTKDNQNISYIKCKLDKNKVLVIIPNDELVYIGEINNNLIYITLDDNHILFKDMKYRKVATGYQLVKNIEFGDDKDIEKECEFIDYESEDGKNIISFAILKSNNEKADIIAEIIYVDNLKFNL